MSKLYSSVQALGGTSHFTGMSAFQLTPSVQYTNYKFSHKHCLEAHHKKLPGSDLYPCILYVLYSAHHAAVTFDDCSRLKLGQKNSDFLRLFVVISAMFCVVIQRHGVSTFGLLCKGQN